MARPWRLRHKLFLGLTLVVASIALLFAGAMFGLSSYVEAMRTSADKLDLMTVVMILRDEIQGIARPPAPDDPALVGITSPTEREKYVMMRSIEESGKHADVYIRWRQSMANADGDPDDGEGERRLIESIQKGLTSLGEYVRNFVSDPGSRSANERIIDKPFARKEYNQLFSESTELISLIRTHIEDARYRADRNHRRVLWVAGTSTVVSIVLILTMLYYFKVWVFSPISQLQAGVQRVHGGNFDHPIRLDSQDELEELANEFNAMTVRLRDIYKDLAQQVNERSRQLVRSERMVSVGFLAAGVAHEINNPLASIAFCAEALERRLEDQLQRLPKDDVEVLSRYLKVIQTEAFRCKTITQKMLDFSRSGERKREPTDLGRLIQDVIDVARLLPTHRNKTIQFTPAYLVASISPPDMKSVVLNLIVNALDSMDEHGVLTVSLAQIGAVDHEQAEIMFRDTGCGMTPEVLENIFEPFFTRRRTGNGTGLGLSISHQIIDQHGGSIHAGSDGPGQGSTFIVRVPIQSVEVAGESVNSAENPSPDVLPLRMMERRAA